MVIFRSSSLALAYRLTALRNRVEARGARDGLKYAIGSTEI